MREFNIFACRETTKDTKETLYSALPKETCTGLRQKERLVQGLANGRLGQGLAEW
jgi:hypothetical protein